MEKEKAIKASINDVYLNLTSTESGLSSNEAENRLKTAGLNLLKGNNQKHILLILLNQFKNSLIYLLIAAAILSLLLKNYNDAVVILLVLVINTGLGFYQEYKSVKASEHLQKLIDKEALVIRDNIEQLISEKQLVPGDIVILKEGDVVPADVKLISVEDLSVNESQLTGESEPINKSTSGKSSIVYAGSIVESGEGKGIIYATANYTELGKIAELTSETIKVTNFEKSLTSFSNYLVKVTFLTLIAVFILKLIITGNVSHVGSLAIYIIALSIAVVPEAMPVIVTVTLSRGALKLAKQHVIAKSVTAVEDLGNINILCSDKTGTLTENYLRVAKLYSSEPKLFQLLAMACLENKDEKRKKYQNTFDSAFIEYIPDILKKEAAQYKRLYELPFDPNDRRRRVVISNGKKNYFVAIGSAETVLNIAKSKDKTEYLKIIKTNGQQGLRHIGISYKELKLAHSKSPDLINEENNLKFIGFVSLENPLRPSSKHTIELAEKLGVGIKILSGDSPEVTAYVGNKVGLLSHDQSVITGAEIDKLSDDSLADKLKANNVFARLNPEQKYRIIKLLKSSGNVVGYQGDGINDAPALKVADVAIAVNSAADVAQDSADILLLRQDLAVIVNGIKYGREIFANINKYIRFTLVSNWGNFFALATLFLMSSNSLPILPVQVLLTSLLTDLPCITIASDNVDTADLQRPSKFNVHSLMFISIFLGSITAVFEIMYFTLIRNESHLIASTSLYLFITYISLIVILSIRSKHHFWHAPKLSKLMGFSFIFIAILALALIYIPKTAKLLTFGSLSLRILTITVLMTIIYLFVLDVVKTWFYKTNLTVDSN